MCSCKASEGGGFFGGRVGLASGSGTGSVCKTLGDTVATVASSSLCLAMRAAVGCTNLVVVDGIAYGSLVLVSLNKSAQHDDFRVDMVGADDALLMVGIRSVLIFISR